MCGRFTFAAAPEIVAELFELTQLPELAPRYNVAPTQPVPVVRVGGGAAQRRLDHLHWGLIPAWADGPEIGSRMINARAETVADKPAFRSAFKYRRCLIAADGFYEWQPVAGSKRKQPFYIRLRDGAPFAFAGLWERWDRGGRGPIESCTIITTDANELMRPIHPRMPVILAPQDYAAWLEPGLADPAPLKVLLRPYPDERMTALRVTTVVNNPRNDSARCIEPAGEEDAGRAGP
ncbi:MAG: SOS response-associated peptidase [Planctomycetes bacterium]|nr:SOS response-associated peptidase [Planctomycetota bacterium]